MLPLYERVSRFLVRGGYRIRDAAPGFAIAELDTDDPRDRPIRLFAWVGDETLEPSRELDAGRRAERAAREDAVIRDMIAEMQSTPDAVGNYVVATRQGLSADFIRQATDVLQRGGRDKRGGIRTALEFFDTDYKTDTRTGRAARASALGQLFERVRHRRRVAQPFLRRTGLGAGETVAQEGDLVEHLDLVFRDPVERATLRLIDGPAGGGKTVAFETLVKLLYDEFIDAKRGQIARPRPLVFLPDHIRGEGASGYVDDVIEAALEAEAAQPVTPEQAKFLLNSGYSLWMFDGLDEFFGHDNTFFDYLGNELANPDSRAQVLICSRDSLLSSSTALRSFIEQQLGKGAAIELYELAPWGPDAWRKLAWMELESGIAGRESSPRVNGFVEALTDTRELSELATLPFYCTVLVDEFRAKSALPADPLVALDTIVDRMLAREGEKGVFRWRDFVDLDVLEETEEESAPLAERTLANGRRGRDVMADVLDKAGRENLQEILGAVALGRVRGTAAGVEAEDLRAELGAAYVDGKLDDDAQRRVLTAIVQFAFFGEGKKAGAVDFSHPILAEHLAARYGLGLLRSAAERLALDPGASAMTQANAIKSAVRAALGTTRIEQGSVFLAAMKRGVAREPALAALLANARGLLGGTEKALARNIDIVGGEAAG